jgi:hypothetical protein
MDVGNIADVAEIPVASTFKVKVCTVIGWLSFCFCVHKIIHRNLPTTHYLTLKVETARISELATLTAPTW